MRNSLKTRLSIPRSGRSIEAHVHGQRSGAGRVIMYLTENQAASVRQIKCLVARHRIVICPMTRNLGQPLRMTQHIVELGRLHVARRILVNRQRLEVRFTAGDLGGLLVAQIVGE